MVTSVEQQLQKAIRESLEEAKKAKAQDDNDDSSASSVVNGENRSTHELEAKMEHTNGSNTSGFAERDGRQRKKSSTKRHADADVNPIAKYVIACACKVLDRYHALTRLFILDCKRGVQKAELCAVYVGVGVLNDRLKESILYRGHTRFLVLFVYRQEKKNP